MKQARYEVEGNEFWVVDPELQLDEHHLLGNCEKTAHTLCYRGEKGLHGPSIFYSDAGQILSLSWYINGKKEGKVHRYYSTGELYALERYKGGLRHGEQEYFYQEGVVKTKLMYQEGSLEGEALLFWPDGKIKRRSIFKNGVIEDEVFYDELQKPVS